MQSENAQLILQLLVILITKLAIDAFILKTCIIWLVNVDDNFLRLVEKFEYHGNTLVQPLTFINTMWSIELIKILWLSRLKIYFLF